MYVPCRYYKHMDGLLVKTRKQSMLIQQRFIWISIQSEQKLLFILINIAVSTNLSLKKFFYCYSFNTNFVESRKLNIFNCLKPSLYWSKKNFFFNFNTIFCYGKYCFGTDLIQILLNQQNSTIFFKNLYKICF